MSPDRSIFEVLTPSLFIPISLRALSNVGSKPKIPIDPVIVL